MYEASKSVLAATLNNHKEKITVDQTPSIQYKQVGESNDFVVELRDEKQQEQFNKLRQEYLELKTERKKEEIRVKQQEFGLQSSDEDNNNQDQRNQVASNQVTIEFQSPKRSIQSKASSSSNKNSYKILLELKKLSLDTHVTFLVKQFEINKKLIPYSRVSRVSLFAQPLKWGYKLKIGIAKDDDIIMYVNSQFGGKQQSFEIFMRLVRIGLQNNEINLSPIKNKVDQQDFSPDMKEGALIFDKIFKKSQIICSWEQRYVVVRSDGVYSYRNLGSKSTMNIAKKLVKEIQTKFEMYKESMVVRLLYGTDATDFGVPLDDDLSWIYNLVVMALQDP